MRVEQLLSNEHLKKTNLQTILALLYSKTTTKTYKHMLAYEIILTIKNATIKLAVAAKSAFNKILCGQYVLVKLLIL